MPPFDDPLVRAAFASATGRPRLIRDALSGNQLPALTFTPPPHLGQVDRYVAGMGRRYFATLAQDILARRGDTRGDWPEVQRRRSLDTPIPEAQPPPGYTRRPLGDVEELPARSWLSWRTFHPDEPHDKWEGWDWYPNIQRAPLYRRDLDIVAVAPSGELASFCTLWFDDVTRAGYVEPVGTAPEHQRAAWARP